jgi:hypothetical protein
VNDEPRKEIGKETQLKFDKTLVRAILQYESDYWTSTGHKQDMVRRDVICTRRSR